MLPSWRLRAACIGTDPELFFPRDNSPGDVDQAKEICSRCPVISLCAQAGAAKRYGIWAGLTPEERGIRTLTA